MQQAVDEGMLHEDDVLYLSEVTLLIWKGMMTDILNHRRAYSQAEAMQKVLQIIHKSVMMVIPKEKQKDVSVSFNVGW
ncbi:hypothetical protein HNR44_001948 [Geomicrobium halophilum]|uniref:Uncharacterized protein n=1 Tax=Geomicrobium halophilum TaxID=549000 RepID=A0A841PMI9_9BACL|nr:hypothetical protein [Geomicrobium halophilum]MBB6449970.1 hypothetical protein [Geomicrobium halophilum]